MVSVTNVFHAVLSMAWISNCFASVEEAMESLQSFTYSDVNDPNFALMGYASVPSGLAETDKRPAVVILPDWDNVNEYEMMRASMISEELGYVAFTADIYGADMHDIQDFNVKGEQAGKYRGDVDLFNSRIQSAINTVKNLVPNVDPSKIAVIGYCLGGSGVLTYSFANTDAETSDIVGAVSFHGGLMDFNVTGEMASPVLVLSGGNDDAGTAVEDLEDRLKSANATWQITRYSGVVHGFTKFGSDAYNEWVDERSWFEMSTFLFERFGEVTYGTLEPSEDSYLVMADVGTDVQLERASKVTVDTVSYDDDGFALEGYLAVPPVAEGTKRPAVVIIPDWDGVNGPTGYEAERAVLIAQENGYVAMVADIYGTNFTNVEDFAIRREQSTFYRSDPELYVKRIQAGINQVMAHPAVDTSNIFVAGYCFGGTGAIDYAFSAGALENVKAVVPLHGGLTPLRAVQTDKVQPYVLILSGGVDDAHGNTTELELHLDAASATWEISRYSNAQHGFTKWDTSPASRYQAMADSRSWWAMMSLFETLSEEATEEPMMDMKEEDDHEGEDHDSHDHDSHDHGSHDEMTDEMMNEMSSSNRAVTGLSVLGSVAAALFAFLA